MEINTVIGAKLNEIQKKPDEVKLFFEDSKNHKTYVLAFKGFLFETSTSTLNKRVKYINITNTLGFKAISQLRRLRRNPDNYRQLFIQMDGSNDDDKMELLCALRSYRLSPKEA